MQPQITEKPAFTFVGVRIRTTPKSDEISQLWSEHGERLGDVPHPVGDGAYGVMEMSDMAAGTLDYMAAVAVSNVSDVPNGMSRWDVPAATYAVFEATLPTLGQTFDTIYGEWLPNADYQRAAGPDLEQYGPDFNPHDPASKLAVYIPVTAKG